MIHIPNRLKKGFTLLELLVVISIIGILLAVGATAFTTAQKRGRDARRMEDVKSMQNAFEQYYAQNGDYAACETMASLMTGDALPEDPKNTGSYVYTCTPDLVNSTYCVCAQLENETAANSSNATCSYGDGTFYCLENLQ